MTAFLSPASVIALAASAALTLGVSCAANAAPGAGATAAGNRASNVVKVDYRARDRRHYRRYRRGHVVDAPFAHVESGRRTVVDAPFVHVYKGRHGKHIVAPFVDIWEPR
jgi:hypothetical protein